MPGTPVPDRRSNGDEVRIVRVCGAKRLSGVHISDTQDRRWVGSDLLRAFDAVEIRATLVVEPERGGVRGMRCHDEEYGRCEETRGECETR